jgi:hypothetical protein
MKVWVPETRLPSCDLVIFVDEAGESVESADVCGVGSVLLGERSQGSGLSQTAVRAVVIEVVGVFSQHGRGVAFVDDEDAVEELAADAGDEAFGDGIRSGWFMRRTPCRTWW